MGQNHSPFARCLAFLAAGVMLAALALPSRAAAADQYEDDDAWTDGSTIVIDAVNAQHHDFHDEGDQDWARFEVLVENEYDITTGHLGPRADTVIFLYGPWPGDTSGPGPLIASDDDGGWTGGESRMIVDLEPGVYFVQVHQHPDNNLFGEDTEYDLRVDIYCPCPGYLYGHVTDSATGYRIYGATVRVSAGGTWHTTSTDAEGYYELELPAGSGYQLTVTKTNYNSYAGTAPPVPLGGRAHQDAAMSAKSGTGTIAGHVYGVGGAPLDGARVVITGVQFFTDPDGFYSARVLAGSGHTFMARKAYYLDATQSGIVAASGGITVVNATLIPADSDGDGLSDLFETRLGSCTDPGNADTDGDGIMDGVEDLNHDGVLDTSETDPCDPDTDNDGLNDGDEVNTFFTSPRDWDSDGDYLPDLYETMNMAASPPLDPLNALDGPVDFETSGFEDGNPNYQEYWNGSDPWGKDPVPSPLFPDSPGCYYWAEGDGDGLTQSGDRSVMQLNVLGLPADYNKVLPNNGDGQDLDGDGMVMVGDLTILRGFILNTSVGIVGSRSAALEQVYEPLSPVAVGGTAHVTVRVRNEGGVTNNYSAGFSVLFSIDPSSTGSAVLLGGDGSYGANTRFDVSGPSGASDGGHATMHLKVTAPGTIIINASIPACGIHGIGKWVDEVTLDPPFSIATP